MGLLEIWKKSRDDVLEYKVDTILKMAGGDLRDGNEASEEFRTFLREAPNENLLNYAQNCLDNKFDDGGYVLQDIVNEIGRRLEFDVKNGLYRGKKGEIGYDGIWRDKEKDSEIVIEVKTASHIMIELKTIAKYKRQLIKENKISGNASILIVIGRGEGTDSLEAQIRGSRYAWEIRLISVDGLSNLLRIKQKSNEDATVNKIKEILQPVEYTKIDRIIDVIFTTTEDVESQDEDIPDMEDENKHVHQRQITNPQLTKTQLMNKKRDIAIKALGKKLDVSFLQHRNSLFYDRDKIRRACASVSKRYKGNDYWYAHHESQKRFLEGSEKSYLILICADKKDKCFAIPYKFVKENLEFLHERNSQDGSKFWHISIFDKGKEGMIWHMAEGKKVPMPPDYIIPMTTKPGESS